MCSPQRIRFKNATQAFVCINRMRLRSGKKEFNVNLNEIMGQFVTFGRMDGRTDERFIQRWILFGTLQIDHSMWLFDHISQFISIIFISYSKMKFVPIDCFAK